MKCKKESCNNNASSLGPYCGQCYVDQAIKRNPKMRPDDLPGKRINEKKYTAAICSVRDMIELMEICFKHGYKAKERNEVLDQAFQKFLKENFKNK